MALVAYGSSGDSDSDYDDDDQPTAVPTLPAKPTATVNTTAKLLAAPSPSITTATEANTDDASTFKLNLPAPKTAAIAEEEDDEFLRKKPTAYASDERPPPPPKALTRPAVAAAAGGTVKIVLPALSSFAEHKQKEKPLIGAQLPADGRPSGLLSMLPKPKSAQFGQKVSAATGKVSSALVPDSIARPRPKPVAVAKKPAAAAASKSKSVASTSAVAAADSDDDDDAVDFFSFNKADDDQLPEVSAAEIDALVASKSARMSKAVRDLQLEQDSIAAEIAAAAAAAEEARREAVSTAAAGQMTGTEIAALCGSRAATKRSRHGAFEPDNIIELRGDQVMPDRDEWLRQQLTGTTEYQPRGLVDTSEGPGAGTKRKHQITYLAHQAKANEQELQAMWAANRNTRRQTQNKYGF